MTKKIRFPLELADGTQARTLEDLQEHFDLESVLAYYKNGKLLTWLKDRYLESEAEAVEALDETVPDFQKQFCEIFGVEYRNHSVDLAEIEQRQARMSKLRTCTDEKEFIDHIDLVAFDQEELADLLDDGQKEIYLCGERFSVPVSQRGVHYIGVNSPVVHLSGKLPENLEEVEVVMQGCEVENMPRTIPVTTETVAEAMGDSEKEPEKKLTAEEIADLPAKERWKIPIRSKKEQEEANEMSPFEVNFRPHEIDSFAEVDIMLYCYHGTAAAKVDKDGNILKVYAVRFPEKPSISLGDLTEEEIEALKRPINCLGKRGVYRKVSLKEAIASMEQSFEFNRKRCIEKYGTNYEEVLPKFRITGNSWRNCPPAMY